MRHRPNRDPGSDPRVVASATWVGVLFVALLVWVGIAALLHADSIVTTRDSRFVGLMAAAFALLFCAGAVMGVLLYRRPIHDAWRWGPPVLLFIWAGLPRILAASMGGTGQGGLLGIVILIGASVATASGVRVGESFMVMRIRRRNVAAGLAHPRRHGDGHRHLTPREWWDGWYTRNRWAASIVLVLGAIAIAYSVLAQENVLGIGSMPAGKWPDGRYYMLEWEQDENGRLIALARADILDFAYSVRVDDDTVFMLDGHKVDAADFAQVVTAEGTDYFTESFTTGPGGVLLRVNEARTEMLVDQP